MSVAGLSGVEEFALVRGALKDVQSVLQEGGIYGEERFVLVTGRRVGIKLARLSSLWVPTQYPQMHRRGLSVTVPGEELRRLNGVWANQGEELMAQFHSHPGHPFHSETDNRFSMVTVEGGLSIVVPLFGYCDLSSLSSCAVFRLQDGSWTWTNPRDAGRLIRLV